MSDVFEGPGWWMASDGKWYAPERHPDPTYRTRFESRDTPEAPAELVDTARSDEATALDDVAEEPVSGEPASDTASPFSVAPPAASPDLPIRPVFDIQPPASVVEAPGEPPVRSELPTPERQSKARLHLEVDRPTEKASRVSRTGSLGHAPPLPTAASAVSTSLVHVPAAQGDVATQLDRILATLIFLAGVAMIVGSFLTWTDGAVTQTGWERGDGIFTIVAGVLGSAAAGPIFVGFRHILPKFVAIVAGLFGLVVVGLVAIGALFDDLDSTSLGAGFAVVLLASIVMVGAGLADRGEVFD